MVARNESATVEAVASKVVETRLAVDQTTVGRVADHEGSLDRLDADKTPFRAKKRIETKTYSKQQRVLLIGLMLVDMTAVELITQHFVGCERVEID